MVGSPTSEDGQIHFKLVERERDTSVYNMVGSPTSEDGQIHFKLVERERDTSVYNMVGSPTSEGGQIHFNPAAIIFTPTLHFNRQNASFLLKPTITLSSLTYFFHVPFGLPFFS